MILLMVFLQIISISAGDIPSIFSVSKGTSNDAWFHVLRLLCSLCIDGCVVAREVYPIDSPWAVGARAVSMRDSGRENEELVGLHLEFAVVYPIPSRTFYAIDEHVLAYRLMTFAEVAPGMRIVAYVGNVEAAYQGVLAFHFDNHFGQHD